MQSFHSDYRHFLFDRRDLAALLASSGFPLKGLEQNASSEHVAQAAPQWMRIYAAKSGLRTYEMAWILEVKSRLTYIRRHFLLVLKKSSTLVLSMILC